jgi:hypothetical protein
MSVKFETSENNTIVFSFGKNKVEMYNLSRKRIQGFLQAINDGKAYDLYDTMGACGYEIGCDDSLFCFIRVCYRDTYNSNISADVTIEIPLDDLERALRNYLS